MQNYYHDLQCEIITFLYGLKCKKPNRLKRFGFLRYSVLFYSNSFNFK